MRRLIAALLLSIPLAAQGVKLSQDGCMSLAEFVYSAAQIRDLGASEAKHAAIVEQEAKDAGAPEELRVIFLEALAAVYKSKAGPETLARVVFDQCIAADGKMGEGV